MSWLFLPVLEGGCSPESCSAGEPSAPSSAILQRSAFSRTGNEMGRSSHSASGATSARSTADHGEVALISFLAAFPVKPIPPQLREETLLTISGRKCSGSWQMSLPGTSLPKTSADLRLTQRQATSRRWITKPSRFPLPRQTWVATTFGSAIGYLHTPTTQGNYCAPSMQKHPSCRAWRAVFGSVTPEAQEWLMDWPIGWTASGPLATANLQSWQSRHFMPWQQPEESA